MTVDRWSSIESRIASLEQALHCGQPERVASRQLSILSRIDALSKNLNVDVESERQSDAQPTSDQSADAGPIQARLTKELKAFRFSHYRFVRAPADYYDQPLEYRQGILNAPSIHHLCKTMIMENTRAHPSVDGWSNPLNSKYYLVIVQYTARLHAEKLKNYIHKLNSGSVGKQFFNMRLAPQDVSDQLSGYEHNAVTPIAISTRLPIVLSHQIAALDPPRFWLGAGEVDLKVELPVGEFVEHYKPFVADCTYA